MAVKVKMKWNKTPQQMMADAGLDTNALLFAARAWHRLYADFVPTDTGRLRDNVSYVPGNGRVSIRHNEAYAAEQYLNAGRNGRGKNPLGTAYWDRAAEAAGKKAALLAEVQGYVKR